MKDFNFLSPLRNNHFRFLAKKLRILLVVIVLLPMQASAQTSIYKALQTPFYDPNATTTSCVPSGVEPGQGAPDGAQFPNINPGAMSNAINQWIAKENPRSTLSGLGATIVASSKNSNISPFLVVAIAAQESSLGDPSDWNVANANNAFGRTATTDQPHVQGAKLWYKWSSVKASVDFTSVENQGVTGGGDMPAYLRYQYSSDINSGDLLALFLKYAPAGDGNDPQAYAAKVTSWINDMVKLSGQTPSTGTTSSGCGGGIFAGDIIKTTVGLAWPSGDHGPSKSDATPEYQTALPQYNPSTSDYSDCGGFVATVMIASGADTNYVGVYVPSQYKYVSETAATKYQIIKGVKDTSQLQPGDILMYINPSDPSDSHTFLYVGQQPNFNGDSAAASLGGHVPEAVSAAGSFSYNNRAAGGNYMAVRLVQ